jgi:hypothetical protein
VSATTPGQAAYEAFTAVRYAGSLTTDWSSPTIARKAWEAAAQAAIDAATEGALRAKFEQARDAVMCAADAYAQAVAQPDLLSRLRTVLLDLRMQPAEARIQAYMLATGTWDRLSDDDRAVFAGTAQAAAAQPPQPAPGLQAVDSVHLYHWRFDRGEEFGIFRHREDADAMAAKRAGEVLSEVLSMAILGRPEQPGGSHIGRSWSGHGIEDDCPCPKAPCGLVVQETVAETCDQHPLSARRTIRQSHRADECPAAQPQPARELAGATAETRRYRAALAQIASMAEARGAVRSVSNIARIARKALEGQ